MDKDTIYTAHLAQAGEPPRLLLATLDPELACEALDNIGVISPATDWECLAYAAGGSEAGAVGHAAYWGADPERVDALSVWYSEAQTATVWIEEHTV